MLKLAKLNNAPEIFYTIQGEGVNIGQPSIFIRTALCNLHCVWCDTAYTWNWEGTPFKHQDAPKYKREELITELHTDEIIPLIRQWGCKNLVFTGGEPMLQQLGWIELMQQLRGYHFEIETNATLAIRPEFDNLIHQYNCSPKLQSSGNENKLRLTSWFKQYTENVKAWFKFVITTQEDLEEVQSLVQEFKIDKSRVILMPEGRTKEELEVKSHWLVEIAKEYGFRFTPRLHVNLWGAKRGV